jgi:hypothetical protein
VVEFFALFRSIVECLSLNEIVREASESMARLLEFLFIFTCRFLFFFLGFTLEMAMMELQNDARAWKKCAAKITYLLLVKWVLVHWETHVRRALE